jgi:hypothetical protein
VGIRALPLRGDAPYAQPDARIRPNGPGAVRRSMEHEQALELTGDPTVDAALTVLDGIDERPVREHVAVFDGLHGALADRLVETRE